MKTMSIHRNAAAPVASIEIGPLAAGFLALQVFLGYEWLMSGLSKLLSGTFASGLAGTLTDMTQGQSGLYKDFVDGVVIPNAQLFGVLVMAGEIALGVVFATSVVTWLMWWAQMGVGERTALLVTVGIVATIGAFMSLNFHFATGATPPWLISPDPNDQGVDLDSLMAVMQVVLVAASLRYLYIVRRALSRTIAS
jgi:uncharacterized membrane protein YphA (DoxX/SURF4 family)